MFSPTHLPVLFLMSLPLISPLLTDIGSDINDCHLQDILVAFNAQIYIEILIILILLGID
jgi:hypothetical protein